MRIKEILSHYGHDDHITRPDISEKGHTYLNMLDVQFVDVIGKQPTDNNSADGGKPRILYAGRVNFA